MVAQEIMTKANQIEESENQWAIIIENLPKYDESGEEIVYTVNEVEVNSGDLKFYQTEATQVNDNQATIRNTFEKPTDTTEITVYKTWNDEENANDGRPESILLQLKDGEDVVKEQTINANQAN